MTPEGCVKKQLKSWLNSQRVLHFWPVPTGYGSPMLDCFGSYRGRFFAVEVKAPGNRPTPRQQAAMSNISHKGGAPAFWGDSVESLVASLREFFRQVDRELDG
jgi:hypothetical protein